MTPIERLRTPLSGLLLLAFSLAAQAQVSVRLSDTVSKGIGVVNLLKDLSGAQLQNQISSTGKLFFGMDINENASGNESANSIGVALKGVMLTVTTTTGTYTFSNFSTSSSAMLQEAGSTESGAYYTLFGQIGSSQLTSASSGFDLGAYDDVLSLSGVAFSGDVLSAQMSVTLLNTGNSTDPNSTFFDFSGGFEDLALLSPVDALKLENANIGVSDAPAGVTFASEPVVVLSQDTSTATTIKTIEPTTTTTNVETPPPAPAAPAPSLMLLLLLVVLVIGCEIQRKSILKKSLDFQK